MPKQIYVCVWVYSVRASCLFLLLYFSTSKKIIFYCPRTYIFHLTIYCGHLSNIFRSISIMKAIFNITVTKQVLTNSPFSGLVSTYLWLTDKPCPFFNNKMVPIGKLVITVAHPCQSLPIPAFPLER